MPNRFELLVPDVLGSFNRGRERVRQEDRERLADQELRAKLGRENEFRQLAGQAYGAPSAQREQFVSQAASLDPQAAAALGQNLGAGDDRRKQMLGEMSTVLTTLPPEQRPGQYQRMVPLLRQLGLEAPDQYTEQVDSTAQQLAAMFRGRGGQTPAGVAEFEAMTAGMPADEVLRARKINLGLEGRAASGGFGFRTVTLPDGRETLVVTDPRTGGVRQATAQEVQAFMSGDGGPSPGQAPGPAGTPSGPSFVGPTPGQIEADKARGKAGVELATAPEIARQTQAAGSTGKAGAERQAGFINEGLSAADSIPVINRALELIDSVPTGGIDAAKLAATNFFGVTGADEGELSNNLGKAVLSQLRATFGAQFTEREGQRLEGIEAGFGKSTAVNKRLLSQIKSLVERAARRGADAARAAGDEFSAQEIERSLRMTLSPGSQTPQPRQAAPSGPGGAPTFATEAEAESAGLAPGTRVIIGGVSGTWQ